MAESFAAAVSWCWILNNARATSNERNYKMGNIYDSDDATNDTNGIPEIAAEIGAIKAFIGDKKTVKRIKSGKKRGKRKLKKFKRKFRKLEKLFRQLSKTEVQRYPVTVPWWSEGVNNSMPKVVDLLNGVLQKCLPQQVRALPAKRQSPLYLPEEVIDVTN
jgi:hypothetical protein